jgi:hypothetical protein
MEHAAGVALPPTSAATTWTWSEWAAGLGKLTRRQGDAVGQLGLANVGSFVRTSSTVAWPICASPAAR